VLRLADGKQPFLALQGSVLQTMRFNPTGKHIIKRILSERFKGTPSSQGCIFGSAAQTGDRRMPDLQDQRRRPGIFATDFASNTTSSSPSSAVTVRRSYEINPLNEEAL